MEKPPYFPFFVNDFLSDSKISVMTTQQVGAVILLLCRAWHEDPVGTLPDDDFLLSKWTRMTPDRWKKNKAVIMSAFELNEKLAWQSRRMKREHALMMQRYEKRLTASIIANKSRWNRSESDVERSPNGVPISPNQNQNQIHIQNQRREVPPNPLKGELLLGQKDCEAVAREKPKPESSRDVFELVVIPSDKFPGADFALMLAKWIDCRMGMGKKPKRGWRQFFQDQVDWISRFKEAEAVQIISASVLNNWVGLHEPRVSFNNSKIRLPEPDHSQGF